MKGIKIFSASIKQKVYSSAPGYSGLTMYWLIVISVILMSAYLVGGLIPKRFPDLNQQPKVTIKEPKYNDARNSLQLRTFTAEEESTESSGQSGPRRSR